MKRWRTLLWPSVATAVALAILLSLGTWQLTRRTEKADILAALERGIAASPIELDSASRVVIPHLTTQARRSPQSLEYESRPAEQG